MNLAMEDKAWFMNIVPFLANNYDARILDYGCADCALGRFLVDQKRFTGTYIGVDADLEMGAAARAANTAEPELYKRLQWKQGTFCTTTGYDFLSEEAVKQTTLVLNSVIHEVHSYCLPTEIHQFWDNVWYRGWQRIAIRDMAISRIDADHWIDGVRMLSQMPLELFGRYRLWHKDYGSQKFASTRDVIHFLLKYRYTENWERESAENYLPLYWEEIISMVPSHYRIVYAKSYCLPFIQQTIANDTGIKLEIPTHYQLLLEAT